MLDSSSLNSISWQVSFAFVTHLFEKIYFYEQLNNIDIS